jgi:hypothetical protein
MLFVAEAKPQHGKAGSVRGESSLGGETAVPARPRRRRREALATGAVHPWKGALTSSMSSLNFLFTVSANTQDM